MCDRVEFSDGAYAIVCGTRQRRQRCRFCDRGFISKRCDFPVRQGKTCDRGMCDVCATNVGEDRDHCPLHRTQEFIPEQQSLFGSRA